MFSNFALVVRSLSIRPGLSPEDEEVKRKLAKCHSWVYSKLIRLNFPRPSGVSPSRTLASRPSLPFVMKTSRERPSVVKPTREELQARFESLANKKMSVKRKAQAPPESSLAIWSKVLRLGASSPPSTTKGWGSSDQVPARGQSPPPVAEVPKAVGPKNSSRRSVKLPLSVLPISVQSPLAQDFKRPPTTPEDEGRGCFETEGEEDSLLANLELVAGAVSFILRDSDLRRADAMSVEDVMALSLQGAATVCSEAFICFFPSLISIFPSLCLVPAGGYLCEELGEEGLSF